MDTLFPRDPKASTLWRESIRRRNSAKGVLEVRYNLELGKGVFSFQSFRRSDGGFIVDIEMHVPSQGPHVHSARSLLKRKNLLPVVRHATTGPSAASVSAPNCLGRRSPFVKQA